MWNNKYWNVRTQSKIIILKRKKFKPEVEKLEYPKLCYNIIRNELKPLEIAIQKTIDIYNLEHYNIEMNCYEKMLKYTKNCILKEILNVIEPHVKFETYDNYNKLQQIVTGKLMLAVKNY